MPVSVMPTVTFGEPVVTCHAAGAEIFCIPQSCDQYGSVGADTESAVTFRSGSAQATFALRRVAQRALRTLSPRFSSTTVSPSRGIRCAPRSPRLAAARCHCARVRCARKWTISRPEAPCPANAPHGAASVGAAEADEAVAPATPSTA
jgi:hypothetical protein